MFNELNLPKRRKGLTDALVSELSDKSDTAEMLWLRLDDFTESLWTGLCLENTVVDEEGALVLDDDLDLSLVELEVEDMDVLTPPVIFPKNPFNPLEWFSVCVDAIVSWEAIM